MKFEKTPYLCPNSNGPHLTRRDKNMNSVNIYYEPHHRINYFLFSLYLLHYMFPFLGGRIKGGKLEVLITMFLKK